MKNILVPVLLFMLMATTVNAQKMYFRGGMQFAIPQGGFVQDFDGAPSNGSYSSIELPTNTTETFDLKKASYSSGAYGVLAIGVMIKNIGVELNANIGVSPTQYNSDFYYEGPELKQYGTIQTQAASPLFVTPSLVLQTGGKINLYTRVGIAIAVNSTITERVDYTVERYNIADSTWVLAVGTQARDYTMKLSPGFSGALGLKIKATKKMQAFAEIGVLAMNLYLKEAELTEYTLNGQSELNNVHPSQRTTKFEFKGTNSGSMNTKPTAQMPFSNLNISAGVSIGF